MAIGSARRAAALARLIPQFNGTDNYATLNTPAVMATSDTLEFQFASLDAGVLSDVFDGVIQFDAAELLQLTNCTATFDGTPVADGASISAYLDGAVYTVILTFTGADTITYVGKSGVLTNYLQGHILSFTTTISSVETEYVLDTKTPTDITYTNFDPVVDWHTYKLQAGLWAYQGSGITDSQLVQFEGTTTTPLSSSITVTGSTWEMNWEGLWVGHYLSGAGAYTYLSAPDGVPMQLDIHDPASVLTFFLINLEMSGEAPNLDAFTSGTSIAFQGNQFIGSIPGVASIASAVTLQFQDNQFTGAIPSLSSNTSLATFYCNTNTISGYTASTIAAAAVDLRFHDNALTVTAVDQILSDVADSVVLATRTGTLFLHQGTNAAPTGGAANADVVYLQSQGWTVLHN